MFVGGHWQGDEEQSRIIHTARAVKQEGRHCASRRGVDHFTVSCKIVSETEFKHEQDLSERSQIVSD